MGRNCCSTDTAAADKGARPWTPRKIRAAMPGPGLVKAQACRSEGCCLRKLTRLARALIGPARPPTDELRGWRPAMQGSGSGRLTTDRSVEAAASRQDTIPGTGQLDGPDSHKRPSGHPCPLSQLVVDEAFSMTPYRQFGAVDKPGLDRDDKLLHASRHAGKQSSSLVAKAVCPRRRPNRTSRQGQTATFH
ncbi:hypothetical protein BP6252_10502 [Coleophoma cylindrospora]|uniref:Uncharacterized protein n=1 Tax=Coleophoma cylindrospora TaxID=1849047 RepID=A0A3D8QT33_9HELO|nr:hypothetical protein BP6252_10502 [Coleophoma cylindrospora]